MNRRLSAVHLIYVVGSNRRRYLAQLYPFRELAERNLHKREVEITAASN